MVASEPGPLGATKPVAATVAAYRRDLVGVTLVGVARRIVDDDAGLLTSSA